MSCSIIDYQNKKRVQFYNESTNILKFIGDFTTMDEAKTEANKIEIRFYKKKHEPTSKRGHCFKESICIKI